MGKLQPIQGVGATDLGLQHLIERVQVVQTKEVILATNYTTEERRRHIICRRLCVRVILR